MRSEGIVLRSGAGEVTLVPDRAYRRAFTLRVGDTDQSYVDLDDPRRLEFDYVQRIAEALDVVAPTEERLRVVHVGGAGLTLARYVAATRPSSAQVVFEPDGELTALVRERLPLPPRSGIKVRDVDGRTGIASLRNAYADVVILDAFLGPRVPAELVTVEFFADVTRVLTGTTLLVVNLTDRAPFAYGRRVIAAVQTALPEVAVGVEPATLKGRRFGNVVVLASSGQLPLNPLAAAAGRSAFPYRIVHGPRLAQLVGGATPFTDADSTPSPEPPAGSLLGW